ncbi:MAG: hypothetical protein NWE89_05330 [Candidatus Bathyarchaeota archaeon]|nr:hypothetical protein [Candidatus Bathyarchaeota archaeon]
MEELKVVVNQRDAKHLLSREDYETLELFAESIRRGRVLLPWAKHEYYRLIDELKDKKHKEHAEMLTEEYAEKLKEEDLSLEELSDGWAVSSRQEAIEFLTKAFPDFEKILAESDPANWLPGCIPQIRDATKNCVNDIFEGLMSNFEHPEAFDYDVEIWPFVFPHVNYTKIGVDSLEFCLRPYAVYSIKVHRAEHDKNFRGRVFTFPSSERALCLFPETLDPATLIMALPKITVPLRLLLGLASGDLQPDGCEVIKQERGVLTYQVEGFEAEVVLPHDFVTFLMELGEEPLKRLQELGLLSEITFKILTSKKEKKTIETPVLREKDKEQLRIIAEVESRSSWGGWGEVLDMSRQGAKDQLLRFEERGLIELERPENGEIRTIMAPLGQACLV